MGKNLSQELSLGIAQYTPGHLTQLNDYSQVLISWLYIMEHLTFLKRLVTDLSFRNNLRVSFLITWLNLLAIEQETISEVSLSKHGP